MNRHIAAFFGTNVLKEVRISRYLHNNSAVLIPKFQNKAIVSYVYIRFIYDNVFYTFLFCSFINIFFEKLKISLKAYFLHNRIFIKFIILLNFLNLIFEKFGIYKVSFYKARTKLCSK